jgi:hypothetical protein
MERFDIAIWISGFLWRVRHDEGKSSLLHANNQLEPQVDTLRQVWALQQICPN